MLFVSNHVVLWKINTVLFFLSAFCLLLNTTNQDQRSFWICLCKREPKFRFFQKAETFTPKWPMTRGWTEKVFFMELIFIFIFFCICNIFAALKKIAYLIYAKKNQDSTCFQSFFLNNAYKNEKKTLCNIFRASKIAYWYMPKKGVYVVFLFMF